MSSSSCPFGFGSHEEILKEQVLKDSNTPLKDPARKVPTGYGRLKLLYEHYVHLPQLRAVWDSPLTDSPVLEPCFAAGMHGIELGFLLLSEFIADDRTYVAKRPRIERVADDIAEQCRLLVEVVDGELEEGGTTTNRLTLTQSFPFPGAPPVSHTPGHSPGLARLEAAVRAALPAMSLPERNSLIKVIINLTSIAFARFERWSVGLGIEPQLNSLRNAVGLPPLYFSHSAWLDYNAIVRPGVVEKTLTGETYTHHEDFFFRTVHLGTDCWARVALARLQSASEQVAAGEWHVAAARMCQASKILHYLGSHVLLLTSMNLRDYLLLKVELEGTSGEGSIQVKNLRPAAKKLLQPLADALLHPDKQQDSENDGTVQPSREDYESQADWEISFGHALMEVYENPDKHREHYNYAKALEDLESGLLGGFYYQHFCLASNVIGSDAKGTMKRAVQALKSSYETPLFPVLDRVRSGLGAKVDAELAHVKGRMMQDIIDAYLSAPSSDDTANSTNGEAAVPRTETVSLHPASSGCPFGYGSALPLEVHLPPVAEKLTTATEEVSSTVSTSSSVETALAKVYSWEGLPPNALADATADIQRFSHSLGLVGHPRGACGAGGPLSFLDHAWGQVSPRALHAALKDLSSLFLLGNPAWDDLFGRVMPACAAHIQRLLSIPSDTADVHFGHNSHELVIRLLSESLLGERTEGSDGSDGSPQRAPLRVLTSDSEFYSLTRQLNRLAEVGAVDLHAISTEPAATFAERCIEAVHSASAAGQPYDVVYVSQVTYLRQETLIQDVEEFFDALAPPNTGSQDGIQPPLIIVDGYHAFCAFPVALGAAAERCCYVGGLLKHAGCGANCAFITVPRTLQPRPALTGWLADPSVLGAGSAGIEVGSAVGWHAGLELQGGTPAFFLPLLMFDTVMKMWQESTPTLDVDSVHAHVVGLQEVLINGLPSGGSLGLTQETLVPLCESRDHRSHTLVFEQPGTDTAKAVVDKLQKYGVLIDCRKRSVRVGLGPNHTAADVAALLHAVHEGLES